MSSQVRRKLTTILAADAAGYSRAMENDEIGALGALKSARRIFTKFLERHEGRIANTAGDGLIAEFPSVVEAVQCAIEVQRELAVADQASKEPLRFRIGIHLGDVLIDGDDLLGEGVNLAARLQTMAEPGGIMISQQVYDQVHAKLSVGFEFMGNKRPKNYSEDVPVYAVCNEGKRRKIWSGKPAQSRNDSSDNITDAASPAFGFANINETSKVKRAAILVGAACFGLIAIDVATGPSVWAHFPVIALTTLFLILATPLFVRGSFNRLLTRSGIIIIALLLINLATWSGTFWALWPTGALAMAVLVRNVLPRES